MQIPPASVLQSWPKPNTVNPETRGNAKLILNIVLYSILFCFMSIRIFTRTYLRKIFGADDIFILLAMIPTTAFFVISIVADTKLYWTLHSYDIPASKIPNGLKMVLVTELIFGLACTLTKLSMLMLVRRMLKSASSLWRRITLLAIAIVATQGTIFCFTVIFQCRPPQNYWKVTIEKDPNCIDDTASLLAAGIINTLTDFIVVLLPIKTVMSVSLPIKQRIPIVLLFAFGFISCFAGIARTYYTYQISQTWDKIWASYPIWVTASLELYIGIICASIPATNPFFSTYLPKFFGGTNFLPSRSALTTPRPYHLGSSTGDNSFGFEEAVKLTKGSGKHVATKSTFSTGESTLLSNSEGPGRGILVTRTVEHVTHRPSQLL
ncbi:hypothetical protein HYALB_00005506 [Hymenoscyphus albidus]|uniref:Rhodopsin domain-containing protein n=1 Tax=Hymenoscyphus albidus TaxID=595503 RepID=A0A9N9M1S2_9HELO|nr:hypothetical protein HYALB_00005506 [Hymenoscyphus albidus]